MMSFTPFLAGQEIDLADCELLKSGRTRNVHEHRSLPGVLIKTLQPGVMDADGHIKAYQWWKKGRPHGAYFSFRREIDEFIVICRRHYGREISALPFARIHGLVMTSAGLGLIVERISDKDGDLAPTMRDLMAARQFERHHLHAMEGFLARCRDLHVVFGDLTINNIVYTEARDPQGEFVAIDGFGEKSAIPLHRWSRSLNDRKIERVRSRLIHTLPTALRDGAGSVGSRPAGA
jgi:hypothetical protein